MTLPFTKSRHCGCAPIAWAFVAATLVSGAPARSEPAAVTAAPESGARAAVPDPWAPEAPSPSGTDWIQLNSQEWLSGALLRIRDGKLFFESDRLGRVQVDWADVVALHSPRLHSLRLEGRDSLRGSIEMRDGIIRVRDGDRTWEFPREALRSAVRGRDSLLDLWEGKAALGFAARSGNTRETDFTARAALQRESNRSRLAFAYNGAFSRNRGETTANNHRASLALDWFVSRRIFVTAPSVEYFSDRFQNVDLRLTTGLELGVQLQRRSWLHWSASLGAAHQYTDFDAAARNPEAQQDFGVTFGTRADFDLGHGIAFDNRYRVQLIATDLGKTNHHWLSSLSLEIWGPLEFDVTLVWDRVEKPAATVGTGAPKSNDLRLSVGLGVAF